jgi:hypothetical protein
VTPLLAQMYGIDATPAQLRVLREGRPDGVLLVRRNIETPEQVRELAGILRRELGEGCEIAVRHEGGAVTPFVRGVTAFPGLPALEAAGNAALARDVGRTMGAELASLGITLNLVHETGPMSEELGIGLRCSGIKTGRGAVAGAPLRAPEEGEGAALAAEVAAAALKIVEDPLRLIPAPPGCRAGLLVPRLGDAAHRLPVEDSLRGTAALLRPRVPASVGVLEIGLHPDEPTRQMAVEWMATQALGVFFCFQPARYPAQRLLLEALAVRCPSRIIVAIDEAREELPAGKGAAILRTSGFQACQLVAALGAIFPAAAHAGKRK